MAAPRGRPKPKGSGRPPGMPNKITKQLKDMILGALDDAGGQAYLAKQAIENPGPFLALVGKILPKDIKAEVGGYEGGPIRIERIIVDEVKNTDSEDI